MSLKFDDLPDENNAPSGALSFDDLPNEAPKRGALDQVKDFFGQRVKQKQDADRVFERAPAQAADPLAVPDTTARTDFAADSRVARQQADAAAKLTAKRDTIKNISGARAVGMDVGDAVSGALGKQSGAQALVKGAVRGAAGLGQVLPGLATIVTDYAGADAASEFLRSATARGDQFGEGAVGNQADYINKTLAGVGTSVVENLPAMGLGALTGSARAALSTLYVQSMGKEYDAAKRAGFDNNESLARANIMAAAEVVGERFGLAEQLKVIRMGLGKVPTADLPRVLGMSLLKEQPGEQLTTAIQYAADKYGPAAMNPNGNLEGYLQAAADTAAQTLGQGLVFGAPAGARRGAAKVAKAYDRAEGSIDFSAGVASPAAQRLAQEGRLDGLGSQQPGDATEIAEAADQTANGRAPLNVTPAQLDPLAGVGAPTLGIPASLRSQMPQGDAMPAPTKSGPALSAVAGAIGTQPQASLQLPSTMEALRGASSPTIISDPITQAAGLPDLVVPGAPAQAQAQPTPLAQPDAPAPAAADDKALKANVDAAANLAATSPLNDLPEPTPEQKESGEYIKGPVQLHGMQINVENPAGSVRSGTDEDGKAWTTTMRHHYGEIDGSKGADGDKLDAFIGENPASKTVFVIDQVNPKTGEFDEHKVMIGFNSEAEAREAYLSNYEAGWQGLGAITAMPAEALRSWAKDGAKSGPLGDLQQAQGEVASQPAPAASPATSKAQAALDRLAAQQKAGMEAARGQTAEAAAEAADLPDDLKAGLAQSLADSRRITHKEKVKIQPVPAGDSVATKLSTAISAALGQRVWFFRATGSTTMNGAKQVATVDGKKVNVAAINIDAPDALLAITVHEGYHSLDKDLKERAHQAVFGGDAPLVSAEERARFRDKYPRYADNKVDEEMMAFMSQQAAKTRGFWEALRDKVGNEDFAKIAEAILKSLKAMVDRFKGVNEANYARDMQAVYDVLSDVFAEQVKRKGAQSADTRSEANAQANTVQETAGPGTTRPSAGAATGRVRGTRDTEAPAGEYLNNTVAEATGKRKILTPAGGKVTSAAHAALATQGLVTNAVERFDALVTDKSGKPLAIIGGFKGALAQASVFPSTLVGEAVRIQGAANIWFVHNHPSGLSSLSTADIKINDVLANVFRGSGIEPRGLLAVAGDEFSSVNEDGQRDAMRAPIPAAAGAAPVVVPIVERMLGKKDVGAKIGSPSDAASVARDYFERFGRKPAMLLLSSQNEVVGYVPLPDAALGELRDTGGMAAIYRAISQANARSAILVHEGELGGRVQDRLISRNIGMALKAIEVSLLDIITVRDGATRSQAESGVMPNLDDGVAYSDAQIDDATSLESSFALAQSGDYSTNRQLKVDMQARAKAAAKKARMDISKDTPKVRAYLARVGLADALYAMKSNANAVGWYDVTVRKALAVLELMHPELGTNKNAKFAFTWALAVTSNGIKVDKNFELAEKAYQHYKATGRMPTNIQAGNAQKAINDSMAMFNDLVDAVGVDDLRLAMGAEFTVGQLERLFGVAVTGEFKDQLVRGAAIMGPKIGNGFFSNLNGHFDKLTIDRWLMRTWGRWTGTLIEDRPDMLKSKSAELRALILELKLKEGVAAFKEFEAALKGKLSASDPKGTALAIQKASVDPAVRAAFNKTATGAAIRKTGNSLAKYIDGQKEAPDGPGERVMIREVFEKILADVRAAGHPGMTMSDLQALLWYPERRLYDAAKADGEASEGYTDDEAPDYANAAAKLARASGISDDSIKAANKAAEKAHKDASKGANDGRPGDPQRGDSQPQAGQQADGAGDQEGGAKWRRQFVAARVVHGIRSNRVGAEAASWAYSRGGAKDGRGERVLGVEAKATYKPSTKLKNALAAAEAHAPVMHELGADGAAAFRRAIQHSKDISTFGAAVYVYDEADYAGMRLFVSADGNTGFALKGDDIVSVFSFGAAPKGSVHGIMQLAVQEGGRRLDAFDTVLPDLYAVHGFRIAARMKWNDDYAPAGWDKKTFSKYNKGEPDVVFMAYDSAYYGAPKNSDGVTTDSWDEAAAAQQKAISDETQYSEQDDRAGRGQPRAGRDATGQDARAEQGAGAAGQAAAEAAAGREAPLGRFDPLPGAPRVQGFTGPDPRLVDVAERYAASIGIELKRQARYVDVDPERATRIAAAYEAMPHAPQDPAVREAYDNLIRQTTAQYQALVDAGYKFWFMDMGREDNQAYASSPWNAMRDIRANQTMGVFPTEEGFGTGGFDPAGNPLLADTGITWPVGDLGGPRKRVLANDLFRAVHDAFGHGLEGAGFRAQGEENAWQAHAALFTGSAVGAITSETRGQNSWLNYGPHGESNRTAKVEDTVFADQKTGLMPSWTWEEGRVETTDYSDQTETPEFKRWFGDSKVVDADGKPLVVYHGGRAGLTEFKNPDGRYKTGIFFTDSKPVADAFGKGGETYGVHLSVKRPFAVDAKGERYNEIPRPREMDGFAVADNVDTDLIAEWAFKNGHDGVVVKNVMEGRGNALSTVYIASKNLQIKSATGNRGTFDPNDARIDYADRSTEGWILSRDPLGRFRFGAGAKLYRAVADLANKVLVKFALKPASKELTRYMRQMKQEIAKAQTLTADVAEGMSGMSEAERMMISDIIEKELNARIKPPAEVLRVAASISALMGQQSDELVRLGMLSKDAADALKDRYLPRFYEGKLTAGKIKDAWQSAAAAIMRKPRAMQGIKGSNLKRRGMVKTVMAADLAEWEAEGWKLEPEFDPATDIYVNVHRDFTRQEREDMGEIRDAMFRFVMGYNASQKDIALGRMYERMANDPTLAAKAPRTDTGQTWVQVPDTKVEGTKARVYGKLAGMWVPEEVMSHLSKFATFQDPAAEAVFKAYKKGLAMWKEGKTVLNPVSHMNNVVSNLSMAHFAGVSYWDQHKYVGTMRDFMRGSPMLDEAKDAGLFGGTFSDEELLNQMPEQLRMLAMQAENKLVAGVDSVWNALSWWIRKPAGAAYEAEDKFFRYLLYRDARQRGLDVDDAIDHAMTYIFAYDDLPKGARAIRDIGLPFFSYTYKAVPALAQTLLEHPHRAAAPAALIMAINTMAYAFAAGEEDDEKLELLKRYFTDEEFRTKVNEMEALERSMLPVWMRGKSSIGTDKTIRLGTDDVTGLPLFLDVARWIPGGDMLDVDNNAGGAGIVPQPLMPSNPLLTTLAAMIWNKDTFNGKEVVDANDDSSEALAKRAGWMWRQFAPAIAIQGYHWERGMSALSNALGREIPWIGKDYTGFGRDGLPTQPRYAAAQTAGVKIRPVDLDMGEQFDRMEKDKLIQGLEAEIKRIRRLQQKMAISDQQADAEIERQRLKIDRVRDGMDVNGKPKE